MKCKAVVAEIRPQSTYAICDCQGSQTAPRDYAVLRRHC
jgi:hypothetical protein